MHPTAQKVTDAAQKLGLNITIKEFTTINIILTSVGPNPIKVISKSPFAARDKNELTMNNVNIIRVNRCKYINLGKIKAYPIIIEDRKT